MDLSPQNEIPLAVRLIVGYGTHAGTTAEIREGFYMIGRNRECQIRPKSHSVSDRHCLVQHLAGTVRVFDLDSEHGTFVNEERVQTKRWQLLNHGDRLRCGSYWFDVAIYAIDETDNSNVISDSDADDIMKGVSTQTLDIEDSEDVFAIDDFIAKEEPQASPPAIDVDETKVEEESQKSKPAKAAKVARKTQLLDQQIKKKSRSFSGPRMSINFAGPDQWKIALAAVLMLAVVGYLGWTLFQIQQGTPVKIISGVD